MRSIYSNVVQKHMITCVYDNAYVLPVAGMRRTRVHVSSHKMLTGPAMYVTPYLSTLAFYKAQGIIHLNQFCSPASAAQEPTRCHACVEKLYGWLRSEQADTRSRARTRHRSIEHRTMEHVKREKAHAQNVYHTRNRMRTADYFQ
jgi:hypothetical protein